MQQATLHTFRHSVSPYLFAIALTACAGLLSFALEFWLLPTLGILLILQLAVIVVALRGESAPAIVSGLLGALVFNYFFTEPRFTFHMTEFDDIANMVVFLIVAVISSQVTIHFRSQREELRKAQLKSSLLLSVSHDLRTPLATIIGTLSTLQTYSARLKDEERDELLSGALEESNRLHRYVENLLQATKIQYQAIRLNPQPRDIGRIIRDVIQRFDNPRLRFTSDPKLPPVLVRESLIEQALYNVIDNALKYAPEPTPVTVRTAFADDHTVLIQVEDEGPGINPELRRKIFDPFCSTRSGDSGQGGIGLGLSVAAGLVRAHMGTIGITSDGTGCTLSITLPTAPEPAA
jgi:K+-sensing histidine kinase KdpD